LPIVRWMILAKSLSAAAEPAASREPRMAAREKSLWLDAPRERDMIQNSQ
jgi:hypothetical protein